jgi:GPI mannosyltransferase 1 subunit M
MDFKTQLLLASLLRVVLLLYGEYQDAYLDVKYTDIDYKVYSDASSYILSNQSPYKRHTYRYTPLLAYLLLPNTFFPCFGKLLFILGDIVTAILMKKILSHLKFPDMTWLWLFNPLVFNISTRGSSDSLTTLLVLGTLYALLKERVVIAGVLFGLAVHFRIYPIIYALSFYLYIDRFRNSFFTKNRILFTLISGGVFLMLIGVFYAIYGYEFLYETYLYHFLRKDNRHNFSMYFYLLYLTYDMQASLYGLIAFVPQWSLILLSSFYLAKNKLPLSLLVETMIFVIFNKVCTAQYFIWYVGLMPIVLPKCRIGAKKGVIMVAAWIITEADWLFWGYMLEFQGQQVFLELWGASVLFFLANSWILRELISSYKPAEKLE